MLNQIFQSITPKKKIAALAVSAIILGGGLSGSGRGLAMAEASVDAAPAIGTSVEREASAVDRQGSEARKIVNFFRALSFRRPADGSPLMAMYNAAIAVQNADPNDEQQVSQAVQALHSEVQAVRYRRPRGELGSAEVEAPTIFASYYEKCMTYAENHYDHCINSHPSSDYYICDGQYASQILLC